MVCPRNRRGDLMLGLVTASQTAWEAMHFAGIWRLLVVFVINNNQWTALAASERG